MLGVFDLLCKMSSRPGAQRVLWLPEHSMVLPIDSLFYFILSLLCWKLWMGGRVSGISRLSPLPYRWKPVLQVISAFSAACHSSLLVEGAHQLPAWNTGWLQVVWDCLPDSFFLREGRFNSSSVFLNLTFAVWWVTPTKVCDRILVNLPRLFPCCFVALIWWCRNGNYCAKPKSSHSFQVPS